jgi:hypothetical protein
VIYLYLAGDLFSVLLLLVCGVVGARLAVRDLRAGHNPRLGLSYRLYRRYNAAYAKAVRW